MEILSESVLKGEYYFVLFILITVALILFTLIISISASLIKGKEEIREYIASGSILLLIAIGFTIGGYFAYKEGPDVEYKAIITDYNEVHKGGYEITGQEGRIVTFKGGKR